MEGNRRAEPEVSGGGTGKRNVQLSFPWSKLSSVRARRGIDSDLIKPAAAACRALSMMMSSCSGKIRGRSR